MSEKIENEIETEIEDDIQDQTPDEAPPEVEALPPLDPIIASGDDVERLLGAPHKNLETALRSHGYTLDRIFHRLAMYGGGSKAKTIDKPVMQLALQTQLQFRRVYELVRREQREDQEALEKYDRNRSRGF